MKNQLNFKGSIYQVLNDQKRKAIFSYDYHSVEESFHLSMMSAFKDIKFSAEEKQKLSRNHRKDLYQYINLCPFILNRDANQLIEYINSSLDTHFFIEASDYGAYVCLTAIYSGRLSKNKKIDFSFSSSPIGLFPISLRKKEIPKTHSYKYIVHNHSWVDDFQTLCMSSTFPFRKAA